MDKSTTDVKAVEEEKPYVYLEDLEGVTWPLCSTHIYLSAYAERRAPLYARSRTLRMKILTSTMWACVTYCKLFCTSGFFQIVSAHLMMYRRKYYIAWSSAEHVGVGTFSGWKEQNPKDLSLK